MKRFYGTPALNWIPFEFTDIFTASSGSSDPSDVVIKLGNGEYGAEDNFGLRGN